MPEPLSLTRGLDAETLLVKLPELLSPTEV